jgi:hypothetical protein
MNNLRRPALWILAIAAVSACLAAFTPLSFWALLAIIVGSVLVNGLLATVEDDLPGGFNNPSGKSTPRYAAAFGWIVRGVGLLAGAFILVMLSLHFFAPR